MASQLDAARIGTALAGAGALRAEAARDPRAAAESAARQFEAMLVETMLKSARAAGPESGLFAGEHMGLYRELLDQQLAAGLAARGRFGIADAMLAQLERSGAIPPAGDGRGRQGGAPMSPAPVPLPLRRPTPAPVHERPGALPPAGLPRPLVPAPPARLPRDPAARFVQALTPHAQRAARRIGVDPQVLVAQAALETGWGRHVMPDGRGRSSHNVFGIKAGPDWAGPTVERETTEYRDGQPRRERASFRVYPSLAAAVDDYARLVTTSPRYAPLRAAAGDPAGYARALARSGYATDPAYAEKVIDIMRRLPAIAGEGLRVAME